MLASVLGWGARLSRLPFPFQLLLPATGYFFHSRCAKVLVVLMVVSPFSIGVASADASSPIVGNWGGGRVNAVFSPEGVRLEYDCALGLIDTPVRFNSQGRFTAHGTYESYRLVPDVENGASRKRAAKYDGRLIGTAIELHMRVDGEKATHSYILEKDRKSKLIRCY